MKKIKICDITLKKLASHREVALLFREKTAIASCADSIGVDAVELANIKNLREDTIIYKTIAKNVQNAALAIPVGFSAEEVANAWECIKDAKHPRLQIELPVSTVQMEYTYHIKADKMISKIGELTKLAKELCADVEFSALDATRADEDFLIQAVKEAEKNGANVITVCDDAGVSLPEEIANLVEKVKTAVNVPVYVQVSDRINMGVASAIAAIAKGAEGLKSSMAGKDVLLTGEIADAVSVCSAQIDAKTSLNNTKIHASVDDMLSSINHASYEVESEVSEKKKILLDAESTISQVSAAAQILGYDLSDVDCSNVHKALMQVCEKKDAVGAKEFEAVIASTAMQAPSTYHLESYTTSSSNLASSMSQVTLKCNDEILCGVSVGDGPIDSAFRAIEQCIGHHYELDDFQVQSVTEGKEALGSAVVRLRNNGKLYSGNGISTDIVAASIRAYINALNKIVFEEA
ncbi:MAG: hypothetical protein E7582_07175 [Ruminococcaceae bacterium]|nr:hypothetical protein [Oscillospiraceae bacterium]